MKNITVEGILNKNTPMYFCLSCRSRSKNRCKFFDTPVVLNYNRCFYHSKYKPVAKRYKKPANLEQIIAEEEKRKYVQNR